MCAYVHRAVPYSRLEEILNDSNARGRKESSSSTASRVKLGSQAQGLSIRMILKYIRIGVRRIRSRGKRGGILKSQWQAG